MVGGDNVRYTPQRLREPPSPDAEGLVEAARRERLVLYLGAGVSIPAPSCGPRGNQVADLMRPVVAELLGLPAEDLLEPDLESLAARVEADVPTALDRLKERVAEAWAFIDMEPN